MLGKAITFTIGAAIGTSLVSSFNTAADQSKKLGAAAAEVNAKFRKVETLKAYEKRLGVINKNSRRLSITNKDWRKEQMLLIGKIAKTKDELKGYNVDLQKIGQTYDELKKKKAAFDLRLKFQGQKDAGIGKIKSGFGDVAKGGARLGIPVKLAIDEETAMAEVQKYVKGVDASNITEYSNQIQRLSDNSPMFAANVAKLVAAGGRLGLSAPEAMKFATLTEKIGVAFDISADQSGEMIGKIKSSMKLTIGEIAQLGDAVNYLGANTASNAANISQVLQRSGSIAKTATNMTNAEIASLAATLDSVAPSSEIAATGMKNLIMGLTLGEAATSAQQKALVKLGFDAEEMAERMTTDASGAIKDVLSEIQKLDEKDRAGVLKNLFGKESMGSIAPLIENLDMLKQNFDSVANKQKYAGSVQKEYDIQQNTTGNQLKIFMGRIINLGSTIGRAFLPALKAVISILGAVIAPLTWVLQACPLLNYLVGGLVGGLTLLTGAIKLVVGVKMLLGAQLGIVKLGFLAFKTTLLSSVLPALGTFFTTAMTGIYSVGAAILTTPIGWIMLGIAAVIGAAALIWNYWEPIKGFFVGTWEVIKAGLWGVWDIMKFLFAWSPWGLMMSGIGATFKWIEEKFGWFSKVKNTLGSWFGFGGGDKDKEEPPEESAQDDEQAARQAAAEKTISSASQATPAAIMQNTANKKAVNNNQKINFKIETQPGQDNAEIGRAAAQALLEHEAAGLNGSFHDFEPGLA